MGPHWTDTAGTCLEVKAAIGTLTRGTMSLGLIPSQKLLYVPAQNNMQVTRNQFLVCKSELINKKTQYINVNGRTWESYNT